MSIPNNITEDSVLSAMENIDKEGIPAIEEKYPHLQKFFEQANTSVLTTRHFQNKHLDLHAKVGFGQGTPTHVAWIAFLGYGQVVQEGIYPGILYYKKHNLLFVNFCVSETNPPPVKWQISNVDTIGKYFSDHKLGDPKKYYESLIYKVYRTDEPLDFNAISDDINYVISVYKHQFEGKSLVQPQPPVKKPQNNGGMIKKQGFNPDIFLSAAKAANLQLDDKLGLRFIASLITKPFVILTGLSGSGKTKLALAFVQWLCEGVNGHGESEQFCLVPVGADWTNREPLLGFPNALDPTDYVYPDNGVLELIIRAKDNPTKPFFLILDEMNLSHVERYFADFLSAMESKCSIALHSGSVKKNNLPPFIFLPSNLFIIGTVNIDETTYMFSPKVLDRASVIEFRVTYEEMDAYLNGYKVLELHSLYSEGKQMGNDFVKLASSSVSENVEFMSTNLLEFFKVLKKGGAEFGYRSASEILRYASIVKQLGVIWKDDEIFDTAIMQKLLPKVHGSRRKLEPHLKLMAELCLKDNALFDEIQKQYETDLTIDYTQVKYPVSFEKIMRMYKNLLSNGFTSYAEA